MLSKSRHKSSWIVQICTFNSHATSKAFDAFVQAGPQETRPSAYGITLEAYCSVPPARPVTHTEIACTYGRPVHHASRSTKIDQGKHTHTHTERRISLRTSLVLDPWPSELLVEDNSNPPPASHVSESDCKSGGGKLKNCKNEGKASNKKRLAMGEGFARVLAYTSTTETPSAHISSAPHSGQTRNHHIKTRNLHDQRQQK